VILLPEAVTEEEVQAILDYLAEVNLHAQMPYHVYSRLHNMVSALGRK